MWGRAAVALCAITVVTTACGGGDGRDIEVMSGLAGAPAQLGLSGARNGGLTAIGSATKTVPADRAFVVVTPGFDDFGGGSSLSDADRTAIREAVAQLGIAEDALRFDESGALEGAGSSVHVEVDVAKLPAVAEDVADAVTDIFDNAQKGIVFSVDDCPAAVGDARTEAIDKARSQAEALADAADVELGEIVDVTEAPESAVDAAFAGFYPPTEQPCGTDVLRSVGDSYFESLLPLDAKPEVQLVESVALTFAIGGDPERVISSSGTAEAEQAADEAYIVVAPGGIEDVFPGAASQSLDENRDEIVRALAEFDVPAEEVEIKKAALPVPSSYVSIEIPSSRISEIGKDIVGAVEEAIDSDDSLSGVIFSSSNCAELLARARTAAIADADRRLEALGEAADAQLGAIVAVADTSATGADPCEADDPFASVDSLFGSFGGSGPELQPLDAEPRARIRVSVSLSRAITG
jgi:uncharacterized protein YggE